MQVDEGLGREGTKESAKTEVKSLTDEWTADGWTT